MAGHSMRRLGRHWSNSSRREESPEVTEGGASRRGSRRAAPATLLHCCRVISLSRAIDGFETYVADERRFSPRTVLAYRTDLDRFAYFWETEFAHEGAGKTPLRKIDTLAVRSYLASLHRARLSNRSLARHLSTLRSFFRWACREGHLEKNPARGLADAAGAEGRCRAR